MGQGLSRRWLLREAVQWTSMQSLLCFTSSQATRLWEVVVFRELMASEGSPCCSPVPPTRKTCTLLLNPKG